MAYKLFTLLLSTLFLMSAVVSGTAALSGDKLRQVLEIFKTSCLASSKKNLSVDLSAQFDAAIKKMESGISAEFEIKHEELLDVFSSIENAALAEAALKKDTLTINCFEKFGVMRVIKNLLDDRPIILAWDSNTQAYEHDAKSTGMFNRNRLRKELAGKFDEPTPIFTEFGVELGSLAWQHVAAIKPDVVILHWSAFEEQGFDPKNPQRLSCVPQRDNRCANELIDILINISTIVHETSGKNVKFILYSRTPNLCGREFSDGVVSVAGKKGMAVLRGNLFLFEMSNAPSGFNDDRVITKLSDVISHALGRPSALRSRPELSRACLL